MKVIQKIADRFGLKKSNIIEEDGLNNIDFLSFDSENENFEQKMVAFTQSDANLIRRFRAMSSIGQKMVTDLMDSIEKMEGRK